MHSFAEFGKLGKGMPCQKGTYLTPWEITASDEPGCHHNLFSISAMPAYASKSFEELHWEDFQAGVSLGCESSSTPALACASSTFNIPIASFTQNATAAGRNQGGRRPQRAHRASAFATAAEASYTPSPGAASFTSPCGTAEPSFGVADLHEQLAELHDAVLEHTEATNSLMHQLVSKVNSLEAESNRKAQAELLKEAKQAGFEEARHLYALKPGDAGPIAPANTLEDLKCRLQQAEQQQQQTNALLFTIIDSNPVILKHIATRFGLPQSVQSHSTLQGNHAEMLSNPGPFPGRAVDSMHNSLAHHSSRLNSALPNSAGPSHTFHSLPGPGLATVAPEPVAAFSANQGNTAQQIGHPFHALDSSAAAGSAVAQHTGRVAASNANEGKGTQENTGIYHPFEVDTFSTLAASPRPAGWLGGSDCVSHLSGGPTPISIDKADEGLEMALRRIESLSLHQWRAQHVSSDALLTKAGNQKR